MAESKAIMTVGAQQRDPSSGTAPSAGAQVLQWSVRWLSRWAPGVAEAAGLQLFMTPPRRFRRTAPRVPGLTVRRTVLRSGIYRIAAWEWGAGPAVLLIHGWGGQASQWNAMVAPLVAAGHRVIAPDLPAHGRSSGRRAVLPDLVHAVGTVAWHAGRVQGIVAHSLGATATALALARGLNARRVVLVAPPTDMTLYVRRLAAWMNLSPARTAGLLGRVERKAGAAFPTFDLRQVVPELRTPVLIVHSRQDREVPFSHGEAVAQAWPGAELLPVAGNSHTRILSDAGVIASTLAFLRAGLPAAFAAGAASTDPVGEVDAADDGDRIACRAAL